MRASRLPAAGRPLWPQVAGAVFSPDATRIFTMGADQRAFVLDRASGAAETLFEAHTAVVIDGVVTGAGS